MVVGQRKLKGLEFQTNPYTKLISKRICGENTCAPLSTEFEEHSKNSVTNVSRLLQDSSMLRKLTARRSEIFKVEVDIFKLQIEIFRSQHRELTKRLSMRRLVG
jgi:hypothetical protein